MRHHCLILAEAPGALVEVCGVPLLERLLRILQRCGLKRATVLSDVPEQLRAALAKPSRHRAQVELEIRSRGCGPATVEQIATAWPNEAERVLVIRGDYVLDSRLLQLLDEKERTTALLDSAPPAELERLLASATRTRRGRLCGAALVSRDWVRRHTGSVEAALQSDIEKDEIRTVNIAARSWYLAGMRREVRPLWFPAPGPAGRKTAGRLLIKGSQKGALDFPAIVHGPVENFLIGHLSGKSITPNQLTGLTNLVAWAATVLFATGRLGWGTLLALAVGVLDGLDGKQARVKVETSKIGKLEHLFDAFFEHSWWIAIAWSLQISHQLSGAFIYLLLLMTSEAVAGLSKLSVVSACGRTLDELGDFNRIVRLIGGRRNVYIWMFALGLVLGLAAETFVAMALWAAISATVQVIRASLVIRAHRTRRAAPVLAADAGVLDAVLTEAITDQ